MFMRRTAIYIFTVLLTFSVGSVAPALWEVSVLLAKDFQKDLREMLEPSTFKCGFVESPKQPELIDLAAPLPPAQPESSSRRKAQSNARHAADAQISLPFIIKDSCAAGDAER